MSVLRTVTGLVDDPWLALCGTVVALWAHTLAIREYYEARRANRVRSATDRPPAEDRSPQWLGRPVRCECSQVHSLGRPSGLGRPQGCAVCEANRAAPATNTMTVTEGQ